MRVVGIIPAAGYATRVQPLHCSKEVFPIDGRPVMDYLLDRMRAGGATEVRVVTRAVKGDVVDNARRHGATVIEGQPPNLSHSIGLALRGLGPRDIVMLGFPDTVWEPLDGFRPLVDAVRSAKCEAALGLFPAADPNTCDVVITDSDGRVVDIEVKSPSPSSNVIWGCLVARAGLLRGLARTTEVGDHIRRFIGKRSILGLGVSDTFVDIGKSRQTLRGELAGDGS